ncbi:XRE family transcriptional regulator [Ectothiorhodospiraceae bacterium BW-2]|nr:XRE family transcriptional regulator [Ectothiorhodospiraceae bacterium BW-2]
METGLDRTYISLMERGLRAPSIHTLFVLAQHLACKPSQMMAELEEKMDNGHSL